MTIRLRVLALGLLCIASFATLLWLQYDRTMGQIDTLAFRLNRIHYTQDLSQLTHELQKERGLSVGFLASPKTSLSNEASAQRRATDRAFEKQQTHLSPGFTLSPHPEDLQRLRLAVQRKQLAPKQALAQYSHLITKVLVQVSEQVFKQNAPTSLDMFSAFNLLMANEKMGRFRAIIYQVFSSGRLTKSSRLTIARLYGSYQEELGFLQLGLQENFKARLQSPVFRSGLSTIESLIGGEAIPQTEEVRALWWKESTVMIDYLNELQTQLLQQLHQKYAEQLKKEEQTSHRYRHYALVLTLVILYLIISTLARILKSLTVMLKSMKTVIRDQNFSIRIGYTAKRDEFGQINDSVNQLLEYTEHLIEKQTRLASTDPLTNLLNRRSFIETAGKELARASRYKRPLCFLMADIDHFKRINDTYGHAAGDQALVQFSLELQKNLRESDLLARWGGEEFVILAELTVEEALVLSEKLRKGTEQLNLVETGKFTCSFGVTEWAGAEDSIEALAERADQALYLAKEGGRNCCKVVALSSVRVQKSAGL